MEDGASGPKQTVTLMRKLAEQDKIFGILGPFSSGEYEVAAPLAAQLQIPIVNTNSVKPGMAANYQPWAFRMTLTDDVSIPASLDFVLKKYPQAKRVLLVGDTKQSSTENTIRNVYPGLLKAKGLDIIGTVDFETSTTDFSAVVSKIKEGANADSTIPKPYVFTNEVITYRAAMVLADGLRKGNITPDSPLDKARAAVSNGYKNLKDYKGIASTYTMRPDGDALVAPVIMTVDTSIPAWVTAK